MIKKAQLRYVSIIMSILLGVFGVIYVAMYYITYSQTINNIEHVIDDTSKSFLLPDGAGAHYKAIISTINVNADDLPSAIRGFWYDDDTFSKSTAENILQIAMSSVHKSGKVGNVYYKIYTAEKSSQALFVAVDATEHLMLFKTNNSRTFISLLIIYGLLFLLVMKLSWWVLKPLRTSFDQQKQFISNASHELKTPLSIISANVDALDQGEDNQWISNIKSQTARMNYLVEDMLSLAKLDEGNIKLIHEKFDLSGEVLENVLPFDAVAFEKGKNLNVTVQHDIIYNGDRQSVKKIVNILIDNAIKHAEPKGIIDVNLKKENNKIILTVFNTGSKVPTEQSNKIFERFYRGDTSRSRESGGSGLGLAIAKSIADANKWKISAVSVPNESMTITLIF